MTVTFKHIRLSLLVQRKILDLVHSYVYGYTAKCYSTRLSSMAIFAINVYIQSLAH